MADVLGAFSETFDTLLTDEDLQVVVQGPTSIDVEEWRKHTTYEDFTIDSPQIVWFWDYVRSLTPEERGELMVPPKPHLPHVLSIPQMFWTGNAIPGAYGFQHLEDAFTIEKASRDGNRDLALPTAGTCAHALSLPEYSSYAQLADRLTLAVKYGSRGYDMT